MIKFLIYTLNLNRLVYVLMYVLIAYMEFGGLGVNQIVSRLINTRNEVMYNRTHGRYIVNFILFTL